MSGIPEGKIPKNEKDAEVDAEELTLIPTADSGGSHTPVGLDAETVKRKPSPV